MLQKIEFLDVHIARPGGVELARCTHVLAGAPDDGRDTWPFAELHIVCAVDDRVQHVAQNQYGAAVCAGVCVNGQKLSLLTEY